MSGFREFGGLVDYYRETIRNDVCSGVPEDIGLEICGSLRL